MDPKCEGCIHRNVSEPKEPCKSCWPHYTAFATGQPPKPDRARLRAELAGRAMQGLLAAGDAPGKLPGDGAPRTWLIPDLVRESVRYADALLAELERTAP